MDYKALIICTANLGDVLRSTPITRALRQSLPGLKLWWLASQTTAGLVQRNPLVDRCIVETPQALSALASDTFAVLVNLENSASLAGLATVCSAEEKAGYGLSGAGRLCPLGPKSEYFFRFYQGEENAFRVENHKSYQEMLFEMLGLEFQNEEYVLRLKDSDVEFAMEFVDDAEIEPNAFVVGLNVGTSAGFSSKRWLPEHFVTLASMLSSKMQATVLLLGGPDDREPYSQILSQAKEHVVAGGCDLDVGQFCSLVERCNLVVSSDTFGAHAAIALQRYVIVLFGPTSPHEMYLYGRGQKVVTDYPRAPCYQRESCCDYRCMHSIVPIEIFQAVRRHYLNSRPGFRT